MKLIFTYIQHKGQIIPTCHLEENHQLNPLTGYLNDPMGGPNYFSFLDHSLSILTDDTIQEADISSNSWGADQSAVKKFHVFNRIFLGSKSS